MTTNQLMKCHVYQAYLNLIVV